MCAVSQAILRVSLFEMECIQRSGENEYMLLLLASREIQYDGVKRIQEYGIDFSNMLHKHV